MACNAMYLKDIDLKLCNDEQLVNLSQQQLPVMGQAFTALMARYQRQTHRFCLRYLRQEDDAWEACQETFLRVFRHLMRFERRASFHTWLYRIARNQCLSMIAKRARQLTTVDADMIAETLIGDSDVEVLQDGGSDGTVEQALARLSPDDRQVLRLRFFQDLSLDEVANRLGTRLSAAKMRLYRAQARFKIVYGQASEMLQ